MVGVTTTVLMKLDHSLVLVTLDIRLMLMDSCVMVRHLVLYTCSYRGAPEEVQQEHPYEQIKIHSSHYNWLIVRGTVVELVANEERSRTVPTPISDVL